MGAGGRLRRERVLAVARPVVVVADEGVRVPRAGHPEVGLARAHEGGHAGERTCGNPENRSGVVPLPHCADTLSRR